MTETQIKYWDLKEKMRANRASENLTGRSIDESYRHNVATERLTASQVAEQVRHNKKGEQIGLLELTEKQRHNQETERQGRTKLGIERNVANSQIALNKSSADLNYQREKESASQTALTDQKTKTESWKTEEANFDAQAAVSKANSAFYQSQIDEISSEWASKNQVTKFATSVVDLLGKVRRK